MRTRGKIVHKQLTLQDYLTVCGSNCVGNLNRRQLKKILSIHGFFELSNCCKEILVDAVQSLRMTRPVRSTTKTNFVPLISLHAASLSVRELIKDIQDIGWEECPFQSFKAIEPEIPSISRLLSFVEQVPQTSGKLNEKDQGAPLIYALPCLKFSKKARTVARKHPDNYSWRLSGCMNINGLPYKRRHYKCWNPDCSARKYIDRDANDPLLLIANYTGEHNHTPD